MKVIFTRQARQDLVDIARYLASQNPGRARSYVEELRTACFEIGSMPSAFEALEPSRHSGVCKRVFPPYLIFYRIEPPQVGSFVSFMVPEITCAFWTLR